MPQYLLSVHNPEGGPYATDEERDQAWADTGVVNDEMRAAGVWIFAGGLHDASKARVVREKNGALLHTDGPYLEGKEHIGGFWILDVPDAETAMAWADKATVACRGAVEVRPFQ
jgi:hypothetical protein